MIMEFLNEITKERTKRSVRRAKPTPGPWRTDSNGSVLAVAGGWICTCGDPESDATAEDKANAKLIEIAPAMLDQLREIVAYWRRNRGEMAGELIGKAETLIGGVA